MLTCWLVPDDPSLTLGPEIARYRRVLAVTVDHPLAQRQSVSVEVLADYPVPNWDYHGLADRVRAMQHFPNDQIALIPIRDMPPVPLGLIWCTLHENARIRVLAKVARRLNPYQAHRTRPGIQTTPC